MKPKVRCRLLHYDKFGLEELSPFPFLPSFTCSCSKMPPLQYLIRIWVRVVHDALDLVNHALEHISIVL